MGLTCFVRWHVVRYANAANRLQRQRGLAEHDIAGDGSGSQLPGELESAFELDDGRPGRLRPGRGK
jgi:hypothetical protein